MNIPYKEELYTLRVVVGNNSTTAHPILGTIPIKGCFPLPETKTGTLSTDTTGTPAAVAGVIVAGTGTSFLSELNQGDFLANADGIIRRIVSITSDTLLQIEAPFPVELTGADVRLVKKNFYRRIRVKSTGSATAILQEQNFKILDVVDNDGTPLSYDISAANSEISVTLSI